MPCGLPRPLSCPLVLSSSVALSLSASPSSSSLSRLETRHGGHGVTYRSVADLRAGGFQLRSAQLGRMGRRCATMLHRVGPRSSVPHCILHYLPPGSIWTSRSRTTAPRSRGASFYLVLESGVVPFCIEPSRCSPAASRTTLVLYDVRYGRVSARKYALSCHNEAENEDETRTTSRKTCRSRRMLKCRTVL